MIPPVQFFSHGLSAETHTSTITGPPALRFTLPVRLLNLGANFDNPGQLRSFVDLPVVGVVGPDSTSEIYSPVGKAGPFVTS